MCCKVSAILKDKAGFLRKSGSNIFDSVSVPRIKTPHQIDHVYRTTFSVSIILGVINKILDNIGPTESYTKVLQEIRNEAAEILLSEKSPRWTWNYWRKDSLEHTQLPYPDDLDDTSCALFGLVGYFRAEGMMQKEGEGLAHFINTLNEQKIGRNGPYRTWVTEGSRRGSTWRDVDIAVQSNIANLLNQHDLKIKSLERIFEDKIRNNNFGSKYYPSEAATMYFMSRHYSGEFLIKFGNQILERLKSVQHSLDCNLLVCALLNCVNNVNNLTKKEAGEVPLDDWESWLRLHFQKITRSLPFKKPESQAFCNDPKRDGIPYCNQSSAVTCIIEMEALSSFLNLRNRKYQGSIESFHSRLVKKKIACFIEKQIPQVREQISNICGRILNGKNQREIWLLPFWWNHNVTSKKVVDLSYANILGWAAYRIYDDCLDKADMKSVRRLPIANLCIYEAFATFLNNSKDTDGSTKTTLQLMESAIAREMTSKKADNLQEKSIAHSIGPMIISRAGKNRPETNKTVLKFFKYYLTARQLGDDIRDRQDDKNRGFRNLASGRSNAEVTHKMRNLTEKAAAVLRRMEKDSNIFKNEVREMLYRPKKELALMLGSYATERSFVRFTKKLQGGFTKESKYSK